VFFDETLNGFISSYSEIENKVLSWLGIDKIKQDEPEPVETTDFKPEIEVLLKENDSEILDKKVKLI